MPEGEGSKEFFPSPNTTESSVSEPVKSKPSTYAVPAGNIEAPLNEMPFRPPEVQEISLESINIRQNLQIGWGAIGELTSAINGLKKEPLVKGELINLKPPPEIAAVSMVASVIAHQIDPEILVTLPTATEVKAMRPWLADISRVIGKFSSSLAGKFDRIIEKKGAHFIESAGLTIYNAARGIGQVERPRVQFLKEITRIYDEVSTEDGQWKLEGRIGNLLTAMREVRDGRVAYTTKGRFFNWENNPDYNKGCRWFNKQNFPFIFRLLPISRFPPDSVVDNSDMRLVAAEIMEGVAAYLRSEGVGRVKPAPRPERFNLFDLDTWHDRAIKRSLVEIFAPEQLERIKRELPNILHQARKVLPENGPDFTQSIYGIAKNICELKKQGYNDKQIVESLFL